MDGQRSCADDGGKRPARRAAGKGAPPDARRAESGRHAEATGPGRLYLVATPIGNLEDITFRAVRMLQEADVIAAEDTRQTRKLLNRYGIGGTLVSYHEHNKRTSGPALVNRMLAGRSVALVSDAGMPGISDPGEDLVRLAVEAGIDVVPVPGPNAALSALVASGLKAVPFLFAGFPPRGRRQLAEALKRLKELEETLVFYEAPHRLAATLAAMRDVLGNRRIAVARELTKVHEEVFRGTIDEALARLGEQPPRGEYVLVVEGRTGEGGSAGGRTGGGADDDAPDGASGPWWSALGLAEHVRHYEEKEGLTRKAAMKRAAEDRGLSRRDVYQALLAERDVADRDGASPE